MNRPVITVAVDTSQATAAVTSLSTRLAAIPMACKGCGGLWAAGDLEDWLCLPCALEDETPCSECGEEWSATELDDDDQCWACAARIRNGAES